MAARDVVQKGLECNVSVYLKSDRELFVRSLKRSLNKAGYDRIIIASDLPVVPEGPNRRKQEVVLLHEHNGSIGDNKVESLRLRSTFGYDGIVAIITENPSTELLVQALRSFVDEYLVSGRYLDIAEEVTRLLGHRREEKSIQWEPERIREMGFFRTLGLSQMQIDLLVEYARGFPRQSELAARLGMKDSYLRKSISRIYEKLDKKLAINNPAQLAQLLSICIACGRSSRGADQPLSVFQPEPRNICK
ncbi:MAG: hypothetical protein GY854_20880 [Deltaproteobacteria bacterium]|nr:hypothetical protein [Deltaproteobacteria bacterium]